MNDQASLDWGKNSIQEARESINNIRIDNGTLL